MFGAALAPPAARSCPPRPSPRSRRLCSAVRPWPRPTPRSAARPPNPSTPKNLQIHTAPPAGFPGTNLTALTCDANPEPDLAVYEVVMRETTAANWTSAIGVGNVTSVTLNISKDNVQFGLRAIDKAGHRSPAAFPQVVN